MPKVERLLNMLRSDEPIAYDVETDGLRWQSCKVVGYSVSDGKEAYYIPTRHEPGGNIDNPETLELSIAEAISKRTKPLIVHNGKFDSHMSLNHGIEIGDNIKDTMIAAALIDENLFGYSLEKVAGRFPDIPQKQGKELYSYMSGIFNLPAKQEIMGHYWRLHGQDRIAVDYAESDTLATWHVFDRQRKELYGQNLEPVYALENKLSHVLRKMERRGVLTDPKELANIRENIEKLRYEAYAKLPLKEDLTPYNVRSNKELQEYFELHNFTSWEFTDPTESHPEGQPSFNKLFLGQSDPGKLILEARALDHFKNGFIDPIDKFIHNQRIYTNFNQTQGEYGSGTKTGRLSSNFPNMQQVPKRDKFLGSIFRAMFVATPGYFLAEFDYSQAEPRLFSHYSGEPKLIEGYNSTPVIDMHKVAAQLMGIDRDKAKNLNLGLQYAMGIAKLATQLGISYDEAKKIVYAWKRNFRNVADFTALAAKVAEQRGYVKTILGRRARFPDPRWSYRAANRIVQGGSADILKYQIVKLDEWISENGYENDIKMLLNIHDAVLFEIRDDLKDFAIANIKRILENVQTAPFNLKVPFVADYKIGQTWKEATYG